MDLGRKSMLDKAKEKVTPNSSKSPVDKIKHGATKGGDKFQRDAVPDSEKSFLQSASDKISRSKDHHKHRV